MSIESAKLEVKIEKNGQFRSIIRRVIVTGSRGGMIFVTPVEIIGGDTVFEIEGFTSEIELIKTAIEIARKISNEDWQELEEKAREIERRKNYKRKKIIVERELELSSIIGK